MRADQTALFTDLDGTLFNSEGKISDGNRAAIERFMAEGGCFALSTGRAPLNALKFIGDLPTNAPSVVYNGAGIYDFSAGEYHFLLHLDGEKAFPVFRQAIREFPALDLQLYLDREIVYATPLERAQPEFREIHEPTRFVPLEELRDTPVVKALLLTPPEQVEAVGELLRHAGAGVFELKKGAVYMDGPVTYYETMPPGATKGSALRRLRALPGLRGRCFFAAGDYWNDYELLREADVPVAPANALAEIKAVSRFVTASNDEDAIAHIIDEVIPDYQRQCR